MLRGRWGVLQQLDPKRRANTRGRGREFPTGQQIGRRIRRRAGRSAGRRALPTASGRTASMFYFTARVNSLTWREQSWAKKPRLEIGTRKCDTQSLSVGDGPTSLGDSDGVYGEAGKSGDRKSTRLNSSHL